MPVESRKVNTDSLQLGMFVSRVDRPWSDTPFPIQGFQIDNRETLERVQQLCAWVEIDVKKSRRLNRLPANQELSFISDHYSNDPERKNGRELINLRIRHIQNPHPYQSSSNLNYEIRYAKRLHKRIENKISQILRGLAGQGKLQIDQLRSASSDLVESVIRNPDAFTYLSRMESHNHTVLNYSIRVATWAVLFGRHLDISRDVLSDIALAAMLCKIGYITLPADLFNQQGTPTPQEQEMLKASLLNGVKLLKQSPAFTGRIVKIVSYHLERFDGSGYPRGASGKNIPFLAQIVSIADYYEQITSYDFNDEPLASTDAIRELYRQRNHLFASYIIEEFIQAIGLFPTGSVLRLNNDREAIVIAQSRQSRLKPKVLVFKDNRKWWQLLKPRVIDLAKDNDSEIVASLPALPDDNPYQHKHYFKRAIGQ
ncbi:MAG: hypothetical protein CSA49_04030 [Gammaproteobacteria bacterium]|nr:MAG: hypothetical protein CSA49_04030 [Gammaproteobacteria bacterium]